MKLGMLTLALLAAPVFAEDVAEALKDDAGKGAMAAPAGDAKELDDFVRRAAQSYGAAKFKPGNAFRPVPVRKEGPHEPARLAALVDATMQRRLDEAGVPPSPPATDAEFCRRVHLDLLGVIPTVERTKAFLADQAPDKRAKLVDELLEDLRFGKHMAHYWHDLLVARDTENNRKLKSHDVFLSWLSRQFNDNRPWNETVRKMLEGAGDEALHGEAFFTLANNEEAQPAPAKLVGTASALFLGNQLMCAECHVHPTNPGWSQQDFWGLAAYFGNVRAERAGKEKGDKVQTLATIVEKPAAGKQRATGAAMALADGSLAIPDPRNDGKYIGAARPRLLSTATPKLAKGAVPNRASAAKWFTASENPFFPRAFVNRLWSQLFGRGLAMPLDDINPERGMSHPEVLQLLAEEAVAAKFDVKRLLRGLCLSETYQRSSATTPSNMKDKELFSHMPLKVLPPRVLMKAYADAAGAAAYLDEGLPRNRKDNGVRGLAFFDNRGYDESPEEYSYGVPQMLKLANSHLPGLAQRIGANAARAATPEAGARLLHEAVLSRPATDAEVARIVKFVAARSRAADAWADAAWALLASAEFLHNH